MQHPTHKSNGGFLPSSCMMCPISTSKEKEDGNSEDEKEEGCSCNPKFIGNDALNGVGAITY